MQACRRAGSRAPCSPPSAGTMAGDIGANRGTDGARPARGQSESVGETESLNEPSIVRPPLPNGQRMKPLPTMRPIQGQESPRERWQRERGGGAPHLGWGSDQGPGSRPLSCPGLWLRVCHKVVSREGAARGVRARPGQGVLGAGRGDAGRAVGRVCSQRGLPPPAVNTACSGVSFLSGPLRVQSLKPGDLISPSSVHPVIHLVLCFV